MSAEPALLVLTGPKHSGKSSAGRALQEILGWGFVDVDALIEEREGVSARVLYGRGRDIFQKAEEEAVISLQTGFTADKGLIVAAGGGLSDNEGAVTSLVRNPLAVFVYLEVDSGTAWDRIKKSGGLPAFLDVEDPEAAHALLHERR
ncbi:MAG: shikimate kinase, partial [Spirochaetaceae bacterium]|nr:shikimate kinase [Spirochaetaceae bacterium]